MAPAGHLTGSGNLAHVTTEQCHSLIALFASDEDSLAHDKPYATRPIKPQRFCKLRLCGARHKRSKPRNRRLTGIDRPTFFQLLVVKYGIIIIEMVFIVDAEPEPIPRDPAPHS